MIPDNSVRFGYNDKPWALCEKETDVFKIFVDKIRRPLLPFKEECLLAAKQIGEHYHGEEVVLFYSGGVDSEAMLHSFREAGVKHTIAILHYENGVNDLELRDAYKYFDKHQINDYDLIPFNFSDWVRSAECTEMGIRTQAWSLTSYTQLFKATLDNFKDRVVLYGFGEPWIERKSNKWVYYDLESDYSLCKFFMLYGIEGVPLFYHWSTELLHAYIGDPFWLQLYNNNYNASITNANQIKHAFMNKRLGLEVRPRKPYIDNLPADVKWKSVPGGVWHRTDEYELFKWMEDHGVDVSNGIKWI